MPMTRIPNHDELADLLFDEDLHPSSVRQGLLNSYMENPPSTPIVRRPVGKLVINDKTFELVAL